MTTIDGICLQSLDRIQGGHEIFDLHGYRIMTGHKITEIPIPKAVIKQIWVNESSWQSQFAKIQEQGGSHIW